MTDALGWRCKFGVLGPSTNTVVQPDFDDLRPPGVTNHYSRIVVQNAAVKSEQSFWEGTLEISKNTVAAVKGVLTCEPDYLIMGMSAVTFYGGAEGARKWRENIEQVANLNISIGSESLAAALETCGGIKKIAFLSPYFSIANKEVACFLSDYGYDTVRDICLECPSWVAIAEVPETVLRKTLHALDGDDVDALIQVGTNLSMTRLAAAAERWLDKPVIAINTATYWHALRQNQITDKVAGFGRLLEEY